MEVDNSERLDDIITGTLKEDLGIAGDLSSVALFSSDETAKAVIKSKASGILSGVGLIEPVFLKCDPRINIDIECSDGFRLEPGTVICKIDGPIRGILAAERTILNFLQHLSGIATLTGRYAAAISHTKARLLDTRKTTPMLRSLEKQAVLHGGGYNHRFGLYDMILIKDTHVRHAGGVAEALERAFEFRRRNSLKELKIEVEVQSVEEFMSALAAAPDRIMLDNMTYDAMRLCVNRRNITKSPVELEASGNITLDNIAAVAETGVDYISVGALTHSAPALDIHLIIH